METSGVTETEKTMDPELNKMVAGPLALLAAALFPVTSPVDFNKPLEADEEFAGMSEIKVLVHVPGASYPFVVSFKDEYGNLQVCNFDTEGDSADSDYRVANPTPLPTTIYGILSKDGSDLSFGDVVYDTLDAALEELDTDSGDIGVFEINPTVLTTSSDEAETTTTTTAGAATGESVSFYANGSTRTFRAGDTVTTNRRRIGRRTVNVVKVRQDRKRSLFVQPSDGSNAYWALNSNVLG
jgi:hypothetical protein